MSEKNQILQKTNFSLHQIWFPYIHVHVAHSFNSAYGCSYMYLA